MRWNKKKTPPTAAAVYFVDVSSSANTVNRSRIINILSLNGSQGEPLQASQDSAASAGFVKLKSGHFLVAVSGANHGRQGIWFYKSLSTNINNRTRWDFVDFWKPSCLGSSNQSNCYYGAGGGLNLHVGCDGKVYLVAMHGTDRTKGREDSVLQLFQIDQNSHGKIILQKLATWGRKFKCAICNNSFRWSGGSYVTRDNTLVILDTRRKNGPFGGIGGLIGRKLKYIEINQYVNPLFL